MKKLIAALGTFIVLLAAMPASAAGWSSSVTYTNVVASSPASGGGYPIPTGQNAPVPGTCRQGSYNSNRSESWVAVQPGTENLVGASKFFFENYSTYYDFNLGSYTMPNGNPGQNTQIPGYDCISTGTQNMPPSWTNNTDPNVAFDSHGRAYQVTLPFNAYWVNLHPNGAIGVVYSDDLGRTWKVGNGGKYLDILSNSTSLTLGFVVDKQWVAVNHIVGSPNQDHVYAMWSVFNGNNPVKIRAAVSRDRGQTFSNAATLTAPQATGPSTTYVYPMIDAAGTVYVAFAAFPTGPTSTASIFVTHSSDDGVTWGPFVQVVGGIQSVASFPNTRFRDGILESFAASPTYAGHLYATWENWDGTQMDVMFSQSTDGGATWSTPTKVNDNADAAGQPTDQFQPSVAAGPNGAVAVAFYDRRQACSTDKSILPADQGRSNLCIDTSLQAYKDSGAGAVRVGANARISKYSWDPEQPGQHVQGLSQYACAAHQDPCPNGGGFIGDYFGLAISETKIYALFVSTHYPSSVKADEGGSVYYQQQVLATVPRSNFGSGY